MSKPSPRKPTARQRAAADFYSDPEVLALLKQDAEQRAFELAHPGERYKGPVWQDYFRCKLAALEGEFVGGGRGPLVVSAFDVKQRRTPNKFALADALSLCALHALPMPDWVAVAYLDAHGKVARHGVASWDDVLGAPDRPKGAQRQRIIRDQELSRRACRAYCEIKRERAASGKRSVGAGTPQEEVAAALEVSVTKVKGLLRFCRCRDALLSSSQVAKKKKSRLV